MKSKLFLLCSCVFFGQNCLSADDANSTEYSIRFKENVPTKIKNELHEKLKSKLKYRSVSLSIDAITYNNSDDICLVYKREGAVLDCRKSHQAIKHKDSYLPCNYNMKSDTVEYLKIDLNKTINCLNVEPDFGEEFSDGLGKILSPLWAHNLIGSDLVRELMNENKKLTTDTKIAFYEGIHLKSLPKENISKELSSCTIDSTLEKCKKKQIGEDHGTKVANLVLGEPPIGVGIRAKVTVTKDDDEWDQASTHLRILDEMIRTNTKILSSSLGIIVDKTESELIDEMYKRNMIVVQSAGNDFLSGDESSQPSPEKSIIVGSLSPSGFVSSFSSEGSEVTILAPADRYIPSSNKGKYENFGGTSAAQPLVAGAISNVTSILPDITPDEVKELLVKTAIPTINMFDKPLQNGKGTLNAFKLAKVAFRLKSNWPKNRNDIFNNSTLYNFDEETGVIENSILKLNHSNNECNKKLYLKMLRHSFLLNPQNTKIIKLLSDQLKKTAHPDDALFYDTLLEGDNDQRLKYLYDSKKHFGPIISGSAFRRAVNRKNSDIYNHMISNYFSNK